MKIALVSPYDYPYPGGVTEHIHHLEKEFVRRGHVVKIIAPSSTSKHELSDNIYRIGGIVPVSVSGSIARITLSPGSYRWVKQILSRERFDVVHLHEPLMPVLCLVALRHSKSVNIGTFHAYREGNFAYLAGKQVLKRFIGRLHGRIAVSPPAREMVSRYFPGDYEIIPNGIDAEYFGSAEITPLPQFSDGKLNVLFVGRMEKRKGLRYLLRAWGAISRQYPETRLIVIGEGDLRTECERYVAENRLPNVVFAGFVTNAELPRYYRTAHIFCAPSTGFESQGIVLLEAMAAGRPIVASGIAGYASVITDGVQGWLVPPGDSTSLGVAIGSLLGNEALRDRMGQAGMRTARTYAWDNVASRVLAYYEDVIRRIGRRAHLRDVLRDGA
jgi:phosphatidylinositol alpha-mannosyltransferase